MAYHQNSEFDYGIDKNNGLVVKPKPTSPENVVKVGNNQVVIDEFSKALGSTISPTVNNGGGIIIKPNSTKSIKNDESSILNTVSPELREFLENNKRMKEKLSKEYHLKKN